MSEAYRTTDLSLFTFENTHQIRMWLDADQMIEAVAADVGAALELTNVRTSLENFPDDEKGVGLFYTPGGPQQLATVKEAGFYRLIFQSRKPAAERLKRWVLHDVLPTLRRTGQYQMPHTPPRRRALDVPHEMTVGQIVCFGTVYTHPLVWYTTETLAGASRVSVRRVRDYCRYFADAQLFERIHTHPQKLYRWNPQGIVHAPSIVQAYLQALTALPRDLPGYDVPIWEKESDPRKW